MNEIEKSFLKAWRREDYQIGEELPEYIEIPKDEFSRILVETNKELEGFVFGQRQIIEELHHLLGVHTSSWALAKVAVLMREEEDLQNDILSTILDFCWKHYWDTFENDKSIILDHIEGIIEFVKADIKKRRG